MSRIFFTGDTHAEFKRLGAVPFPTGKELTKDELANLKNHANLLDDNKIISILKSLIRAYSEMRYSPFPIAPLEVAIIENLKP